MQLGTPSARLQAALDEVSAVLERHRVLEDFTSRQQTTRRDLLEHLQHQQNLVELQTRCQRLHPADLAYVIESLNYEDRALVWAQLTPAARGAAIEESSDVVRAWLIDQTSEAELAAALGDPGLRDADAYADDSVGSRISRDVATVRESITVGEALRDLRERADLPQHLDQLSVVDGRNVLKGIVTVPVILTSALDAPIVSVMQTDPVVFGADESMDEAARAFERYDLVSAPVINAHGKLVGRLTADVMIDHIRMASDRAALHSAGLAREEDLFAPVFDSARNRWPWLAVNLLTAFFASRVIGVFEDAIGQLVALATLMPIVASIGGNTGNQTVALVIRGLALDHLHAGSFAHLMRKELTVSVVNGALWGSVMGLFAVAIYRSAALGVVMMTAVLLNLVVAALVGVTVPILLQRAGRDPAQGASVLLTFVTDSMGFFLFLGLARTFLM